MEVASSPCRLKILLHLQALKNHKELYRFTKRQFNLFIQLTRVLALPAQFTCVSSALEIDRVGDDMGFLPSYFPKLKLNAGGPLVTMFVADSASCSNPEK